MIRIKSLAVAAGMVAAAALTAPDARAQWEPTQPIQLVVGFSPGGGTDVIARTLASASQPLFPVPLVIVNRPGAAGTVAAETVAQAEPDGYTLLIAGGSESTSVPAHQELNYDPRTDFTPIIRVARLRIFLAVRADSPWETLDDFVEDVRANPGEYSYASSGSGSLYHSTMLVLSEVADLDMQHVPYQGGAPGIAALLGGHVDIALGSPDEVKAQYEADQIRLLALTSEDSFAQWEEVPTLQELGYDVYLENMKGVVGPAGMPEDVVTYLHDTFKEAMESETFQQLAERSGIEIGYQDGETFGQTMTDMLDAITTALEQTGG